MARARVRRGEKGDEANHTEGSAGSGRSHPQLGRHRPEPSIHKRGFDPLGQGGRLIAPHSRLTKRSLNLKGHRRKYKRGGVRCEGRGKEAGEKRETKAGRGERAKDGGNTSCAAWRSVALT